MQSRQGLRDQVRLFPVLLDEIIDEVGRLERRQLLLSEPFFLNFLLDLGRVTRNHLHRLNFRVKLSGSWDSTKAKLTSQAVAQDILT